MAVTLRLMRFGKKGYPVYRIVALDKRKKRDGAYIEKVGSYQPMTEKDMLSIDKQKFDAWIQKGATLSEGLSRLIKGKNKNT